MRQTKALWAFGAGGAAAVLAHLARHDGPVPLGEIVGLLGDEADVERIIAGVAAIDGVVLYLSRQPPGVTITPKLRARLRRAGHVCDGSGPDSVDIAEKTE